MTVSTAGSSSNIAVRNKRNNNDQQAQANNQVAAGAVGASLLAVQYWPLAAFFFVFIAPVIAQPSQQRLRQSSQPQMRAPTQNSNLQRVDSTATSQSRTAENKTSAKSEFEKECESFLLKFLGFAVIYIGASAFSTNLSRVILWGTIGTLMYKYGFFSSEPINPQANSSLPTANARSSASNQNIAPPAPRNSASTNSTASVSPSSTPNSSPATSPNLSSRTAVGITPPLTSLETPTRPTSAQAQPESIPIFSRVRNSMSFSAVRGESVAASNSPNTSAVQNETIMIEKLNQLHTGMQSGFQRSNEQFRNLEDRIIRLESKRNIFSFKMFKKAST